MSSPFPKLTPLLHSKTEAATLLSVSVRTIDNLIVYKELKATRIGTRVLISGEEIQRFIRRHTDRGRQCVE